MRGRASLLEEVSYETLVLETWRFTFGGSLVFWKGAFANTDQTRNQKQI